VRVDSDVLISSRRAITAMRLRYSIDDRAKMPAALEAASPMPAAVGR
jgi:hypothetical protein